MNFKDLNTYKGSSCYAVVNESIAVWRKLLDGISVERAASICSGGEVSFFSILPCVEKELVLIDHAYGSLYYAIGKYGIIETQGAEKAYELYTQDVFTKEVEDGIIEANKGLPTANPRHRYGGTSTGRVWRTITQEDVASFATCMDKVQFLHGDLNDLEEFGPFDLLYLSNALDYVGRNGTRFNIEKLVKPGGYILYCNQAYSTWDNLPNRPNPRAKGWEEVAQTRPDRDTRQYGLDWIYRVCKAPQ